MRSISVISTQFQLINAVEYIKNKDIKENILFIDSSTKERENKIRHLLISDAYDKVFYKIYSIPRFVIGIPYLNAVLKKIFIFVLLLKKYNFVIIGNYNSVIHKYSLLKASNKNNKIKRVIVDDGTLTYSYYTIRKDEISLKRGTHVDSRFLKILFYNDFFKLVNFSYTFFSMYTISVVSIDCLEKNTMNYLRTNYTRIKELEEMNEINSINNVILGQPFVDFDILSSENYNSVIEFILKKQCIGETIYIRHPAEKKIPAINVNKMSLDLPFECIVFLLNDNCNIYGITTSALVSAKNIRPDLNVYSLDILSLIDSKLSHYNTFFDIYEGFKKSKIEIITF